MIGQVLAALRGRSLAFSVLIAEVAFGMVVVTQSIVFTDFFRLQGSLEGADMEAAFCIRSEDDDTSLAARDLAAMQDLPGVRAAAWISDAPFRRRRVRGTYGAAGREAMGWELHGTTGAVAAFGFELLDGHAPEARDQVAITAPLAKALFGAANPLGQTVTSRESGVAWRVAGVLRRGSIVPVPGPVGENLLVFHAQPPQARHAEYIVNVAAAGRPGFAAAVEAALRRTAPRRYLQVETIREAVMQNTEARTGSMAVFSIIIALVLGVVTLGSAGMSAFLVVERRREIGVRRAMGATRRDIAAYFLFENFTVTSIGLVLGAAGSLAMTELVFRRAVPLVALDFHHLVLGIILFQVTGLLAASVPALRASRVAPAIASKTA